MRTVVKNENARGNRYELSEEEIATVVQLTKGYSGADMRNLCAEASMIPLRSVRDITQITAETLRATNFDDFMQATKFVKATVSQKDLGQYLDWNKQFGNFDLDEKELDT